jgi:ADP-ribose pyrophosphatase YjhB (NUDIX family)
MDKFVKIYFNDRVIHLISESIARRNSLDGLCIRHTEIPSLKTTISCFQRNTNILNLFFFHPNLEKLVSDFESCFPLIEAAGGVISNDNEQILIIKRHNLWDLPKGKMEKNEKYEETAIREIGEEVSFKNITITGKLASSYHTYILQDKLVLKKTHWFTMKHEGDEKPIPLANEDITEAVWIKTSDIDQILANTYSSIIDVLQNAGFVKR